VINGLVVGHANVAFNYVFKLQIQQKRVRVRDPSTGRFSTETITVTQAPVGILRIAGKPDIRLDWGTWGVIASSSTGVVPAVGSELVIFDGKRPVAGR
jgi:hypothetical protein